MAEKLDAEAIALAGGLTWAVFLFKAGVAAIFIPQWQGAVNWVGQFYLGYAPTVPGSVIGAIWGFVDVAIGLYVLCWLYNYFHTQ